MTAFGERNESFADGVIPPSVVATPSEVRADADHIQWWRPSWRDAIPLVGWRWVFLSPGLILLAVLLGAWWFEAWRAPLLLLGAKVLVLVGVIALSLAGYVFGIAARARSEPFCIHCGYNLTGLPDNYRCPECGRPYNHRLIAEYRRDPQWFIERWKLNERLPGSDVPFDAGPIRRRPKDGTA